MGWRTPVLIWGFGATCLQCACSDDGLTKLNPKIEVDPPAIDFEAGIVDQDNVRPLTIRDQGSGVLEIDRVVVEPSGSVFSTGEVPTSIGPLMETTLDVIFVPRMAHEQYDAELVIFSNDPQTPELRVPLTGVGGVREIEVRPEEIDFGIVNQGTAPRRAIEILNTGGDPLQISAVTWTSTSVDLGPVSGTFAGGAILPGTSTVVEITYAPVDLGADSGVLSIASNDEDEPVVDVPVRGRANLAPVAVAWGCDKIPMQVGCDGQEQVRSISAGFRRLVGLDGRESVDPEGGRITSYSWRIVERPQGSNAAIFFSGDDITLRDRATGDIEVDRVGRYDLRLIVRDERGVESLDLPESHVLILPKDLEVLLTWDVNIDADLHVVQPGGTVGDYGTGRAGTSTGTDCSSFNRQPNWNDPGSARDDPRLDKDDVTGRGPEIVSLDFPEESGPYRVFAHNCDSQNVNANANVTIEIRVRGQVVATIPEDGAGYRLNPDELWEGAHVTWDAQTDTAVIEAFEAAAPTSRPDLCMIQ